MSEPIRHHYLPMFYLRRWAERDGRVFRYHRPLDRVVVSPISPKRTGFEDGLYTLYGATDAQIVETDFFSPVDNAAAPVLEHLIAHGPAALNNEQRSWWTRFIMSLPLRGPHSLTEIKSVLDRSIQDNIERLNAAEYLVTKREGDPDSVYEYALQQAPEQFANAHKLFLPSLIDQESIGQLIINMRWAVTDLSAAAHTLLTADRPYTSSHGLGDPACLIGVPLSPTHLFFAANHPEQLRKLGAQSPNDTVRNTNSLMVRLAVENVYGCTDRHLAFVEKRLRRAGDTPVPGLITLRQP